MSYREDCQCLAWCQDHLAQPSLFQWVRWCFLSSISSLYALFLVIKNSSEVFNEVISSFVSLSSLVNGQTTSC